LVGAGTKNVDVSDMEVEESAVLEAGSSKDALP
jgi:hypothetical protein